MKYKKRYGENTGLGYYTCWQKEKENGCIYCGNPATTREHCPSKVFLSEPYPEDLPTIPACFECNNSFSEDEKYVACFLDILKSTVYSDINPFPETVERLSNDNKLAATLKEEIKLEDSKICYEVNEKRMARILNKLAICHAGFEFDYVDFDNVPFIKYNLIFELSDDQINDFNCIPEINIATEVGSREISTPFIIQNISSGEAIAFAFWNDVQEGRYRYQVYLNSDGQVVVKIIIFEFLYCEVIFEKQEI